jgi:Xaa-Pro aminopeptidase
MFSADIYIERRNRLKEQVKSGLLLFLGNEESPINYTDNQYPFRQDSSFLYFFGLDWPSLGATIDIDANKEVIFGDDLTVDDIIWTGPQPSLSERAEAVGISETAGLDKLQPTIEQAAKQGRDIHFLPQYRAGNTLKIAELLDIPPSSVQEKTSEKLIRAVVAQRSIKSEHEIKEIERALEISYEMQTIAMKMSKTGFHERQIAGAMEGIALSLGGRLSFPTIFSIHGETLHNHKHDNLLKDGDIAVNDSGAETSLGYASDITRTIPISGKFSQRQKEIYSIVLNAQEQAIGAIKPGVEFRNIHHLACTVLVSGLRDLGLMKGNIDEAVDKGAHTLFFQCGLGHMLGLDVHDMEGLGEEYVGYTETIRRNPAFGWKSLRLGKELEAGFVITVEPGIYFIPELIKRWKGENKNSEYINYDMVTKFEDFGGVRIEDDVLVTEDGCRVLGKKIPKTIADIENKCSE